MPSWEIAIGENALGKCPSTQLKCGFDRPTVIHYKKLSNSYHLLMLIIIYTIIGEMPLGKMTFGKMPTWENGKYYT